MGGAREFHPLDRLHLIGVRKRDHILAIVSFLSGIEMHPQA